MGHGTVYNLLSAFSAVMMLEDLIINVRADDDIPFDVVNPAHTDLRWAGLWLAAHKYFEVDRRRGNNMTWQYSPRVCYIIILLLWS